MSLPASCQRTANSTRFWGWNPLILSPHLKGEFFTQVTLSQAQIDDDFKHKLCTFLNREVNVSLPEETRANGTLYAAVYVHKVGVSPLEDRREVHYAAQLTAYMSPVNKESQKDSQKVMWGGSQKLVFHPEVTSADLQFVFALLKVGSVRPVSHWRPLLSITMMSEDFSFNKAGLPSDVRRYMRVLVKGKSRRTLTL